MRRWLGLLVLLSVFHPCFIRGFFSAQPAKKLDPAAWGGDHVGKPVPEFVTGGECLFCHRNDVGPTWAANRHRRTVREAEAELDALKESAALRPFAEEAKLVLGHGK